MLEAIHIIRLWDNFAMNEWQEGQKAKLSSKK